LRVKLLCHEEAPGTFTKNNALYEFGRIKGGDYKAILGSADQAALLLKDYRACGTARGINMVPSGQMISVCKKSCALGYYSFGHELAHNIGLAHNRETRHFNRAFSYGQAYLIKRGKGKASTGFRTILGYNYPGHRERVNYYSNPDVIYPRTLTPTGTSVDNNAKVLTVQRFKLADIGDESDYQCSGAPPPTTTQKPTTTAVPIVDCSNRGTRVDRWDFKYAGKVSASACETLCASDWECIGWTHGYGKWCYKLNARKIQDPGYASGPNESKPECSLYPSNRCHLEKQVIRAPTSMGFVNTATANDCHFACRDRADCVAWKYWTKEKGCYLYKQVWTWNTKWNSTSRHCLQN